MITRGMIKKGYNQGLIKIGISPHSDGVACFIGDYWFYYGNERELLTNSIEDYKKSTSNDEIVNAIYATLSEDFSKDECFIDEYNYYEAFLKEKIREEGNEMQYKNNVTGEILTQQEFELLLWDEAERQFTDCENENWANLTKREQIELYCEQKQRQMETDWQELSATTKESITDMTVSEIFAKLDAMKKDALYRMLWSDHVHEDVSSVLEKKENITNEDKEAIIEAVVNAYVYDGKYDCDLSYWDNIDNLISRELEYAEERE